MGGSKNNKAHVQKKLLKRGDRDDNKHSKLNCNGTSYNVFEKYIYVAISLKRQQKKTQKKKRGKFHSH